MESTQPLPSKTIRLRDGRNLGYVDNEVDGWRTVFLFHGFPGSRFQRDTDESRAREMGLRMISVDRPGYGLSDFKPGRQILDWPDDVCELADQLGVDRFSVAGWSGGGPYTLACAYKLAERLDRVAIMCSLAPLTKPEVAKHMAGFNRISFTFGRHLPGFPRFLVGSMAFAFRFTPDLWQRILASQSPESEVTTILKDPVFRKLMDTDLREAMRQGSRGPALDLRLYARDWGFGVEDIQVPVRLWHGEEDRTVPLEMGQYLADHIPQCKATFLPGEGHFIPATRAGELVEEMSIRESGIPA
ncbi:MAG: alpha/beta hydrolase [Planctomycetota bacterium]|nr:MAG: alpha/beta hydrolase [Planctomycetota bacterium]